MTTSSRLYLYGSTSDLQSFLASRETLYSALRTKYNNYFDNAKKYSFSSVYRPSPSLDTSNYIKSELLLASHGRPSSNTISGDERTRITLQKHFISGDLQNHDVAATFTAYTVSSIEPKPAEVHFMGDVSSRLFMDRYRTLHDAVAPTGLYVDRLIEDYDHYPYFDIPLNYVLLDKLGIVGLVNDGNFERQFLTFANHKDLHQFVEAKNLLFEAILHLASAPVTGSAGNSASIRHEFNNFNFEPQAKGLDTNPARLAGIINYAMEQRASKDTLFGGIVEKLSKAISRKKIAIFTATRVETETLQVELLSRGFEQLGTHHAGGVFFNLYAYKDRFHILQVMSSMGAGSVNGSQRVSHDFLGATDVDILISVGICFGTKPKSQKLGDVVVGEKIRYYEPAAVRDSGIQFRGELIPNEGKLVSYGYAKASGGYPFSLHVGPVLTGEKLVDNASFREQIMAAEPKAVGGDMEAGGFVTSCQSHNVSFAFVKGISDLGEAKTDDAQEVAARNACTVTIDFVIEMWGR